MHIKFYNFYYILCDIVQCILVYTNPFSINNYNDELAYKNTH